MLRRIFIFLASLSFLLWMFLPRPVSAQDITSTPEASTPAPAETGLPVAATQVLDGVSSPGTGSIVSGAIEIKGTASAGWNLSFAYADDSSNTWFTLAESAESVSNGTLATWDTTAITDGVYVLRLRISTANGPQDFTINVRVRNYSPLETATLLPTPVLSTPTVGVISTVESENTATATITPAPSPTLLPPLPPNPATLNSQDIVVSFGKGALSIALVFILSGLLVFLSRKLHP